MVPQLRKDVSTCYLLSIGYVNRGKEAGVATVRFSKSVEQVLSSKFGCSFAAMQGALLVLIEIAKNGGFWSDHKNRWQQSLS